MLRNIIKIATMTSALVLVSTGLQAKEWKFNNGLPEGRGESNQLETFAADVARLSNGSLTIDVFHGGSLNHKDNDKTALTFPI
jgi:TRAP-type C4-dicarboxylate transport system substrate-binding protein